MSHIYVAPHETAAEANVRHSIVKAHEELRLVQDLHLCGAVRDPLRNLLINTASAFLRAAREPASERRTSTSIALAIATAAAFLKTHERIGA